jgi:hypothetical protein
MRRGVSPAATQPAQERTKIGRKSIFRAQDRGRSYAAGAKNDLKGILRVSLKQGQKRAGGWNGGEEWPELHIGGLLAIRIKIFAYRFY